MTEKETENNEENSEEKDEETEALPGYSSNKPAYLVQVLSEDFATKKGMPNHVLYVSFKLNYEPEVLKVQGWKISTKETINNLEDAEKHAEREQYFDIHFPWHRVNSIRNITFKRKG